MRSVEACAGLTFRELGDDQLESVRMAVRGIVLAALTMTSGVAVAQTTLPPVIVTGQYPYGWGPDSGSGGGSGTTNPNCTADCNPGADAPVPPPPAVPPSQVPPLSKIVCGAQKYGGNQKRYPTNFLNVFQFGNNIPSNGPPYAYSSTSNVPPPGYYVIYGTTLDPNPIFPAGGSTLYASSVQPYNGPLTFILPNTSTTNHQSRNYSAIEHAVMTAAHEFAHQNGVAFEDRAEGFGVAAADAYKADHGAKCP